MTFLKSKKTIYLLRSFIPQCTFTSFKSISPPLLLWDQCLAENLLPTLTAIVHTVQCTTGRQWLPILSPANKYLEVL